MQLTNPHLRYLELANSLCRRTLRGEVSQDAAEQRLAQARRILTMLCPEDEKPPTDTTRVAPCTRCGRRDRLTHLVTSDAAHLLCCSSCGAAAEKLLAEHPEWTDGQLRVTVFK
jgi:hypothetical protein